MENEEYQRMKEDRDECEREAESLEREMAEIEQANPDNYEEDNNWNGLYHEVNELYNHANYLTHCMEDYE